MKPTVTFNGKPVDDSVVYGADTGLRQPTEEEAQQILNGMSQNTFQQWEDITDEQAEDGATD